MVSAKHHTESPQTGAPAGVGASLVLWFVLRVALLLGCVVAGIVSLATRSIVGMSLVAGFALLCSLLDARVLRLRHRLVPTTGMRTTSVIDTWQPVAAFAALSQVGHFSGGSPLQHAILAVLAVGTWFTIFVSRRIFD